MNTRVWMPTPDRFRQSNLFQFIQQVHEQYTTDVEDYSSLYKWSVTHLEEFWPAVWRFSEIRSSHVWDAVLEDGDKMPGARWFRGARLNFAENMLRHWVDKPALIFRSETGVRRSLSYQELANQVGLLAQTLRDIGVNPGDRVAGYLPNVPETVVAMLATSSIGAVWSSCSPEFGTQAILDRFSQIRPKVVFTTDGYFYNGKWIGVTDKISSVLSQLSPVEAVVMVPYPGQSRSAPVDNAVHYEKFLNRSNSTTLEFEQLPFDHPLYILYSSGTTGPPKCIVHGAGGTLIQHLKEHRLHTDLKPSDTIFYFTTCGWMMWNWLVSSLATGATVVLYDGSPMFPRHQALFDVIEQEGVTIFGASASYLSAIEKAEVEPVRTHDLSSLNTILSTGSPLAPESFDYVYHEIKGDIQLSSISGGTDIISCFALGCPILPVHRGELQCRGLGMKVEIFNEQGEPVCNEKGELVCTAPFPSMPIGFWNDPDDKKYRDAYFSSFPGVWTHGDYAELTSNDGLIIYGRSDTVLNPGGVRIGTAEIYRQVEGLPEVMESLAVGQEWNDDMRIILFVRMREGITLTRTLIERIKQVLRDKASPRHVPAKVIQVADLPRTISGKLVEMAVRNTIHGRPVNLDALANPEALEMFKNLPQLRD